MSLLQLTVKHNLFKAQQLVLISKMLEACGPCYVFSQDSKTTCTFIILLKQTPVFNWLNGSLLSWVGLPQWVGLPLWVAVSLQQTCLNGWSLYVGGPAFMGGSVSTADMSSLVVSLCGWTCLYGSTYLYGWDCLYGWAISNAEHVLEAMEQLKLQP